MKELTFKKPELLLSPKSYKFLLKIILSKQGFLLEVLYLNSWQVRKTILNSINKFKLDLNELNIFTEAASGNYIVTPLIAALGNAKTVWAFAKDSEYGTIHDNKKTLMEYAKQFGVDDRIKVIFEKEATILRQCDIITNTGFVRPIDKTMISTLKTTAVIPLMWETWEFRKEDLDIEECKRKGILVLGTNERDKSVNTFKYVGLIALKMLLQQKVEVYGSNILIIGSGFFLNHIIDVLKKNGARLFVADLKNNWTVKCFWGAKNITKISNEIIQEMDALVICEHELDTMILGLNGLVSPSNIKIVNPGLAIAHICGRVEVNELKKYDLNYKPINIAPFGFMSLSTDYVGLKPLVDLHTAGLKVGEAMAQGRIKGFSLDKTIKYAIKHSPAMRFDKKIW